MALVANLREFNTARRFLFLESGLAPGSGYP